MPTGRLPTGAAALATMATMGAMVGVAFLAPAGSGAAGPDTATTERTFEAECQADPGGTLQQAPAKMTFTFHAVVPAVIREGEQVSFSGARAEITIPRLWSDELYYLGVRSVIGKETFAEVNVSGATPTDIDGFRSSEYTEGLPIEKRNIGYETERMTFKAPTVGGTEREYSLGPVIAGKAGEELTLKLGTQAGYEPGVRAIENQGLQSWITGYRAPDFGGGVVETGYGKIEHFRTACTAPAGVVLVETEIQPKATTSTTSTTESPTTTTTGSSSTSATTTLTTTSPTTTTTESPSTTTTTISPTTTTTSPTTTTSSATTSTTESTTATTTSSTTSSPTTSTTESTTTTSPTTSTTESTTATTTTTESTTMPTASTTTTSVATTTATTTSVTTTTAATTSTSAGMSPSELMAPAPGPEFGAIILSPVIGHTAVAAPTSGIVLVKQRFSHVFVALDADGIVPVGSVIDAAHGVVQLTTALPAAGATQTVTVWDGTFKVGQGPKGSGITKLILRGPRLRCPRPGFARASAAKRRTLWARDHHGRYTTHGANSAATVLGTEWETVETCAGTITRVRRGRVRVRDLHTHRAVIVTAGHSFLARP